MKRLFLCGAALIFLSMPALATDECKTPEIITSQLSEANPGVSFSQLSLENETVVKGFLSVIMAQFGPPPNVDVASIKKIIIYKPSDTEKYNYYVSFFDGKDCKLTAVFVPESLMNQLVK